jgi:hypothetical protein
MSPIHDGGRWDLLEFIDPAQLRGFRSISIDIWLSDESSIEVATRRLVEKSKHFQMKQIALLNWRLDHFKRAMLALEICAAEKIG